MAPGDPVTNFFEGEFTEYDYEQEAKRLGLDKPNFYISFKTAAFPDTLHRILQPERRKMLKMLAAKNGNWPAIQNYYAEILNFKNLIEALPDSINSYKNPILQEIQPMLQNWEHQKVHKNLKHMEDIVESDRVFFSISNQGFQKLSLAYQDILSTATPHKMYLPKFVWHGFDNQYHHWIVNFFKGNFGISLSDGRPVSSRILDALFWTLVLNFTAIILAFAIAIPLGVWSAVRM